MTSDEKTSLDQIVAGDEVAHRPHNGFYAKVLRRAQVQRVTGTWIILDEFTKFRKDSGREVGKDFYRRDDIYPLGATTEEWRDGEKVKITYAQLIELEQAKEKESRRRNDLADFIRNCLGRGVKASITTEQLEQAAKLLGYE